MRRDYPHSAHDEKNDLRKVCYMTFVEVVEIVQSSATKRTIYFRTGLLSGLAIAVFAALAVGLFATGRPFMFPLDDAYITLHNAQVLWTGHDPNYDVPALVGATSLVHLVMVALLSPVFGPVLAAFVVGLFGASAYLIGIERLGERYGLGSTTIALLLLIGGGTGFVLYQLLNGLETAWVLAAVTWAIVLASDSRPRRSLAVLCGVLPFLRPELAALSAALMARQAYRRATENGFKSALPAIVHDGALSVLAALPWLVWTWAQTGQIISNTAGAKMAFFAEESVPLWGKTMMALVALARGLGPVLVALYFVKRSSLAAALWAFLVLFLAAFIVKFPHGLFHNFYRYEYALLPVCLWALCEICRSRGGPLVLIIASLWAAGTVGFGFSAVRGAAPLLKDEMDAAAWARKHIPADQPMLVHDAGLIAYASQLRLVDVVGLKTPTSTVSHERWTVPSGGVGRARAVAEIAARGKVRYAMILQDQEGFWSSIGTDLTATGWRLKLVRSSSIPNGYDIFKLTPPGTPGD